MSINRVGKFEARKLIEEFDGALIELFGVNMSDADITRMDALSAIEETQDTRKAAEVVGIRKGLTRVQASN
jgi:hypothetical protein